MVISDTLWAVQKDKLDSEQVGMAAFEITLFTVLGLFVKEVVKMALSELAAATAGTAGIVAIAGTAGMAAIGITILLLNIIVIVFDCN